MVRVVCPSKVKPGRPRLVADQELTLGHVESLGQRGLSDLLRRIRKCRHGFRARRARQAARKPGQWEDRAVFLSKLAMAENDILRLLSVQETGS